MRLTSERDMQLISRRCGEWDRMVGEVVLTLILLAKLMLSMPVSVSQ